MEFHFHLFFLCALISILLFFSLTIDWFHPNPPLQAIWPPTYSSFLTSHFSKFVNAQNNDMTWKSHGLHPHVIFSKLPRVLINFGHPCSRWKLEMHQNWCILEFHAKFLCLHYLFALNLTLHPMFSMNMTWTTCLFKNL
jgi:hypothetical protein